jgi:HlyD family secretion protein
VEEGSKLYRGLEPVKRRGWWIVAVALGLVAAAVLLQAAWQSPEAVDVAAVEAGLVREYVEEPAKTRLPRIQVISMPYEGLIQPITLEEGDRVVEGQVLANVEPRDLQIRLDEAQAAVARLQASFRENADTSVEQTALEQTEKLVDSFARTVEASEHQVRATEARLVFARREFERQRSLIERNATSTQELNRAENDLVQAEVGHRQAQLIMRGAQSIQAALALMPPLVRQYIARKGLRGEVLVQEEAEARARLEQAKLNRERGTLTSPVNGVVLHREETGDRLIRAGAVLLEIGRLNDLELEAEVLSQDALRIEEGQLVEILEPAQEAILGYGRVRRIVPAGFTKVSSLGVEQQRVKVWIAFDSETLSRLVTSQGIGVGYELRARIVTKEHPGVLRVPRSSLFRGPDGSWQVFVVRGGIARRERVEIGLNNNEWAEVVEGLARDDQVFVAPESNIVAGARVRPVVAPSTRGE